LSDEDSRSSQVIGIRLFPGAPLIRGVRMGECVKGKGRGAARNAQLGWAIRARPHGISRFGEPTHPKTADERGTRHPAQPAGRNNRSPGRKSWVRWKMNPSPVGTARG
jgi:hypothetical protein